MTRFYVPKENVRNDEINVDGKTAHHILDVMRLKELDKVVVFDGTGREYTGFIKKSDKKGKRLVIEIVRTDVPPPEKLPEITLAQAVPKKDKMDYIVEKATELGVSKIIPVITARTIVRPDDASRGKKEARWRSIAIEAAKQCKRRDVPTVGEITEYAGVINAMDQYDLALLACLSDKTVSLKDVLGTFNAGKILVFIGPEGDFTEEEIDMATRDNCRLVSLGGRVLKSDTAGLFVLSVLNYTVGTGSPQ